MSNVIDAEHKASNKASNKTSTTAKTENAPIVWEVLRHQDKYFCVCTYEGKRYCFKYVYDDEQEAIGSAAGLKQCIVGLTNPEIMLNFHPRTHYTISTIKFRPDVRIISL